MWMMWGMALVWLIFYVLALVLTASNVRQAQPRLLMLGGWASLILNHLLIQARFMGRFSFGLELPRQVDLLMTVGIGALDMIGYGLLIWGIATLVPKPGIGPKTT